MASSTNDETRDATRASERRGAERLRSRILADGTGLTLGGDEELSFLGSTIDLSATGACVRTYEALTAGQRVALRFHLPEGDLDVTAAVQHVRVDAIGCRLAGVAFTAVEGEAGNLLARHLGAAKAPLSNTWLATASNLVAVGNRTAWPVEGRLDPS